MKTLLNRKKNESNLGFGSAISGESRERLINSDGSFNVRRKGYLILLLSVCIIHY